MYAFRKNLQSYQKYSYIVLMQCYSDLYRKTDLFSKVHFILKMAICYAHSILWLKNCWLNSGYIQSTHWFKYIRCIWSYIHLHHKALHSTKQPQPLAKKGCCEQTLSYETCPLSGTVPGFCYAVSDLFPQKCSSLDQTFATFLSLRSQKSHSNNYFDYSSWDIQMNMKYSI